MNRHRNLVVELDDDEFQRITEHARKTGLEPGALARRYVLSGLDHERRTDAPHLEPTDELRRQAGLKVLDDLDAFRASLRAAEYPSVDAVELVRQAREELEERGL